VVVLSDWGRSPRMQYHAASLAETQRLVHVVAYADTPCALPPGVTLHALPQPPLWLARLPAFAALPLKAALQLLGLLVALLRVPAPSHLLLQTPPCIPTLAACLLLARLRACRLVLDWHNFGYTLLALRQGCPRRLLRVAERYERALGRGADAHLCVTRAMAAELATPGWGGIQAVVLHDRPAARFQGRIDAAAAHALFGRLAPLLAASAAASDDWAVAELGAWRIRGIARGG